MPNDIKARIEALRNEITRTTAELAELDASIPTLKAALEAARSAKGHYDDSGEATAAMDRLSGAGSRIEHLRNHVLPALDKKLRFYEQVSETDTAIRLASKARATAREEARALAARRDQLAAKIATLQTELDTASARASQAEQAAAQAYARAVANGDDKDQQAAAAALRSAQHDAEAAELQAQRQQPVLEALEGEAGKLEAQHAEAETRVKAALDELSCALRVKHAVEWDDAVDQLARIGARILAAAQLSGDSGYYLFRDLEVRRMAPESGSLSKRALEEIAEGITFPEAL